MNAVDTCALCQVQNAALIDSHTVSKWVYRRIISYAPAETIQIEDGRAGFSGKQDAKYLLCRQCEDLLGIRESYVAQIGLQSDSTTFPALTQSTAVWAPEGKAVVDVSALDVEKIAHFAVSVIWRADLAQSEPIVSLGEWREPLRRYLIGQESLPARVSVVITLLKPPPHIPRVDRVLAFPASANDGSYHEFLACGIRFTVFTSPTMPPPAEEVSLLQKKRALVTDGFAILRAIADEVQTSTAYGKLARDP
jgi:hypothetical protein